MALKLHSAEVVGLSGKIIDVEIDLSQGLFSFSIVGLADKAVSEAKERISAAIKSIGVKVGTGAGTDNTLQVTAGGSNVTNRAVLIKITA